MNHSDLSVSDAVRARRSIKSFKSDPIPEAHLEELVSLMQDAPSSWNFQPTRVVMIRSMAQKEALSAAAWGQKQILEAPVTFVFAVSVRGWEMHMDEILKTGVSSGAWPQKFADWIGSNAPGFQKGLGEKEREYAIKDAMIMATTLALAAQSKGYSTCYINGWDEAKVKEIIDAKEDKNIAIALLLPVGIKNGDGKHPGRLPAAKTIFTDRLPSPAI